MPESTIGNMGTDSPSMADASSGAAPAQAPSTGPPQAPTSITAKTYTKDCAVLAKDAFGPIIASGKALGPGLSKISAQFVIFRAADKNPWIGFRLEFPLGEKQAANEDAGFGVRHHCEFYPFILVLYFDHTLHRCRCIPPVRLGKHDQI